VRAKAPAQARLFVAVELPLHLAQRLAAWGRELAATPGAGAGAPLRVLEADSLHLTLCFLGSRPPGEIEQLTVLLEEACARCGPLELAPGPPVWLPPRRPRALAVEIHDLAGGLVELQGSLERALQGHERPHGRRRYRPHVTVARIRPGAQVAHAGLPVTPAGAFTATTVCLVRSRLEPAGARYETQARVRLESPGG
jgi:2'-5' RNA ligase